MNLYYLIAFSFILNLATGFLAAYMAHENAELRIENKRLNDACEGWQQSRNNWKERAMLLEKERSK